VTQAIASAPQTKNKDVRSLSSRIVSALRSDLGVFVLLLLLNLICYQRSLRGYFLADDFIHIPYLVKVFDNHPELLLQNFYTNWMQAQGTQFYRPLISITLALDYLVSGANPLAYHITNFSYQLASSFFLFLTTRLLFDYKTECERWSISFFAALFFAVCPLHPEVVSWVIGRVDSVATTFLLAAFWLYLRCANHASGANKTTSLICFVLSLLSKEMAVTLPPGLVLYEFLRSQGTLRQRFMSSCLRTYPYWIVLVIYLIIRSAALGTISGGYAGSIGSSLSDSIFRRFFQDGSFMYVLFPLNAELPAHWHRLVRILYYLYLAGFLVALVRALAMMRNGQFVRYSSWLGFALGWFVICLIPTYQVWNLTAALLGSRFIYLGTAPLSLLLALLVAPLAGLFDEESGSVKIGTLFQMVVATSLVGCFALMTYANNTVWATAGGQVRAFRRAVAELVGGHNCAPLAILQIPERYHGAHMLYNAAMLSVLLRPPLSEQDYYDKVFTFEPATFGDADLINVSRLRRLLSANKQIHLVTWSEQDCQLKSLHLVPNGRNIKAGGTPALPGRNNILVPGTDLTCSVDPFPVGVISPTLDIAALSVDFVDLELANVKTTGVAKMFWNSPDDPSFTSERQLILPANINRIRFDVSQHKKWILCQTIHQLKFELPSGVEIKGVQLSSAQNEVPDLRPLPAVINAGGRTMDEDKSGIARPGCVIGDFSVDVSGIKGAQKVLLQISRPDSFFEHYSGTFRDQVIEKDKSSFLKELPVSAADKISLPAKILSAPGFYELRAFATDGNGKVIGYSSDPIVLQFSARDLSQ